MFKKRSKAKSSKSGQPIQRYKFSSEAVDSTNCDSDTSISQIPQARQAKLSIEDLRSRYGNSEQIDQGSQLEQSISQGSIFSSQSSANHSSQSREESETKDVLAEETIDEDWEIEQLRKVGVNPVKPTKVNGSLEVVVERLKKRILELNARAAELEEQISALESEI